MVRPPRALGLVLCRQLAINSAREIELLGMLRNLHVTSWTEPVAPFTAFSVLQGGQGEGIMRVVGYRLATEQEFYRQRRWFVASSQVEMLPYQMILRQCIFPAPGRYKFALQFEGQELAEALLDVHPGEAPS
jgi:hypothetical protein